MASIGSWRACKWRTGRRSLPSDRSALMEAARVSVTGMLWRESYDALSENSDRSLQAATTIRPRSAHGDVNGSILPEPVEMSERSLIQDGPSLAGLSLRS